MHVQLDDGNLEDHFFRAESRAWVEECGCDTGLVVFDALAAMRRTARKKACWIAFYGVNSRKFP